MRLVFAALFILLTGCQSTSSLTSVREVEKLVKQINKQPENLPRVIEQTQRSKKAIEQDIKQVKLALSALKEIVESIWGKENVKLPSAKKYVKYSNDYKARAIVDFEKGVVTVETIAKKQPLIKLKQAIATTLLSPANPNDTDIFSSDAPQLGAEPFLYQQIIDQDEKAIRYQWRANRFADYLIKQKLIKSDGIHSVQRALVNRHQHLRKEKYSKYVLASARRYNIAPDLIYAIIETESSFNPFAVSHANAYGLMQVVPSTAGKDVYQKVKQKPGQPSKSLLFKPEDNIDIGSAYLHLLKKRYLAKINNSESKHYSVISAYNGGAGNVFNTFNPNREKAINNINKLSSKSVFWALTNKHPRSESRRYLKKVTTNQTKYQ
ncbi:DUF3393 domain-containing protein [Thalassotalea sp. M1531]|uniref:DUF3393 domain-containing protein n=1 Tax=Thalassotalea algicola TaxID=2716224 RepID=A0A7Y0Q5X0_9GAMM|nr:murein transglycosylase domain-containing protein [Thalassotalea algicola]NMP30783.1 DUF3393 domain-containing protein [Thalassotalea algicola]